MTSDACWAYALDRNYRQSRLARVMRETGHTDASLGERVNLSANCISHYRIGRGLVSPTAALVLAAALGVTVTEVIGWAD